jgi:hypothetical protein
MLRLRFAQSLVAGMKIRALVHLFIVILVTSHVASCEEGSPVEYSGVVTFQLLPAKVIRINEIVEDPEPGTSYIGDTGILVEVEENPEVMANWTVVTVRYLEYEEAKTIRYEILSEQHEITIKYHAVSVEVTGDLSEYITE